TSDNRQLRGMGFSCPSNSNPSSVDPNNLPDNSPKTAADYYKLRIGYVRESERRGVVSRAAFEGSPFSSAAALTADRCDAQHDVVDETKLSHFPERRLERSHSCGRTLRVRGSGRECRDRDIVGS